MKHACSKPSHRQGAINVDSARPNDMQFVQPFACSVPRSVGQNWRSGLMHAKPCGPECHECFMHVAGVHITCFSLPFLALPECETFLAYIIFQIPVITYIYICIYIYILMLVTCHVPRAALWFHRVVLRFDICTMILFLFLFDFLLLLCLFCPLRCFGRFGLFTFRRLPAPYMSLQKLTCMESMEG